MKNTHTFNYFLFVLLISIFSLQNINQINAQCAVDVAEVCTSSAGPFNFTAFDVDGSSCLANNGPTAGYLVMNIAQAGVLALNVNGDATSGFIDVAVFLIPPGVSPCDAASNNANQISCNFASSASGCASFNDPSCPSNQVNPGLTLNANDRIIIIAENYSSASSNFTVNLNTNAGSAVAGPPVTDIQNGTVMETDAPAVVPQGTNNSGGGTYSATCGACIDPNTGVFDPSGLNGTYTVTYTQFTAGDVCFSEDTAEITVQPATPTAVCQDITIQLDAAGNASITATDIDNGSSAPAGIQSLAIDQTAFTCANVGTPVVVTLTVTDTNGATDDCTGNVTVEDNVIPDAQCQDITIQLDAAGNASISAAQIDNGSSDACGIASLTVAPSAFTCANTGANTVTLTVTDNNGNSNSCDATVSVQDITPPDAQCQDITVQLDAAGNASISAAQIDNGSSDACGIASLAIAPSAFTCANTGANTVTLTVTDNNGNSNSCDATVSVQDITPPDAQCQDITIQLDAAGNASISAAQIDNGSSDACGIASLAVAPSVFTCANVGGNIVTLTVTDNSGNTSSCDANVSVQDITPPDAQCQDITVQLDDAGNESISAAQIDNGSSDACGIASLVAAPTAFTCANVGTNTVMMTVTDNNGNTSSCSATVTVQDLTPPDCQTQDIEVFLDDNGEVSIVPSDVDNGSTDACGIATYALDNMDFTCSNLGDNTVNLTLTDVNGNTSSCSATVTVTDAIPPVIHCRQDVATCNDPGLCGATVILLTPYATDNCEVISITSDEPASGFYPVGVTPVTWSATDSGGNTSTCIQTVTVFDEEAPSVGSCSTAIAFDQDGDCMASVFINLDATDNCGIQSITGTGIFSYPVGTFTCQDIVVTDVNGLSVTHTVFISVHDEFAPTVVSCPSGITVQEGSAINLPEPSFTDNCEIHELNNDAPAQFPLGITTVNWTASDFYGNLANCTYDVEVTPQNIFFGASARIEACVEQEEHIAQVSWNAPSVRTECDFCTTTDYETYTYLGDYAGHQYFLYTGEENMSTVQASNLAAQDLNGHLVSLNNLAENNFLARLLPENTIARTGLSLEITEEDNLVYHWTNQDAFSYNNLAFSADQELFSGQSIALNAAGEWLFIEEEANYSFLVERPCVDIIQTGPIVDIVNAEGIVESTLLTSDGNWPQGNYTVTYEAENMCGDVFVHTFPVEVEAQLAEYCTTGGKDSELFIQSIGINENLFQSEDNTEGYTDFSTETINLISEANAGELTPEFSLTLTAGGAASAETIYWNIWADFNQDGDFFDEDELLLQTTGQGVIEASLATALFEEENIRLRVSASRYDYPEVCADFLSGETEDYLVTAIRYEVGERNEDYIENHLGQNLSPENISVYPNPATAFTYITTPVLESEVELLVRGTEGKLLYTQVLSTGESRHALNLTRFAAGLYFLEINTDAETIMKRIIVE